MDGTVVLYKHDPKAETAEASDEPADLAIEAVLRAMGPVTGSSNSGSGFQRVASSAGALAAADGRAVAMATGDARVRVADVGQSGTGPQAGAVSLRDLGRCSGPRSSTRTFMRRPWGYRARTPGVARGLLGQRSVCIYAARREKRNEGRPLYRLGLIGSLLLGSEQARSLRAPADGTKGPKSEAEQQSAVALTIALSWANGTAGHDKEQNS